jgi:hypothetical protein
MRLPVIPSISLALLIFRFVTLCTVQDEDFFLQGNQYFITKQYASACDAYKKIENKGFVVLYNLSLSYLNQGNRVQAIIYSKRAEKKANFYELTQLYELFDFMHRQIDQDYSPGWYEQLVIFVKKCILCSYVLLLQLCSLIALIFLIFCLYRRFYNTNKKFFFFVLFFYICSIFLLKYKTDIMQTQIGIVTKKLVYVFAGPDESFYKKYELHESDQVNIISKQQDYYQVRTKQLTGWIHEQDIELI